MEQIAFRLTLNVPDLTRKAVKVWSVYESNPDQKDPARYRIKEGRSWLGGKRERATYYTYSEVLHMWSMAVAREAGIEISAEPDPEDYPIGQKVRVAESVARNNTGIGYDVARVRSRPIPDNKHGGFKVMLLGLGYGRTYINLKDLTPVEPEQERWKMVKDDG